MQEDADLYLSVLVLGEIRKGVELARARDLAKAKTHRMTLATRNDTDVAGLGATILNPFKPAG